MPANNCHYFPPFLETGSSLLGSANNASIIFFLILRRLRRDKGKISTKSFVKIEDTNTNIHQLAYKVSDTILTYTERKLAFTGTVFFLLACL